MKPPPKKVVAELIDDDRLTPADLEFLARWLDDVFKIPGVGIRFGLDVLIGLIPGLGDTASSAVSLYILTAATRYGVSRYTILRMAANLAIDYVVGSIPFLGDLFDVYWKANRRNINLLRRHAEASPLVERELRASDKWFVVAVLVGLAILLIASIGVSIFLLGWFGRFIFAGISS